VNAIVHDIEGDRFWLAKEEAHAQIASAEPDLLLDEAKSAQETESVDEHFI
jgi:hypothetical protein